MTAARCGTCKGRGELGRAEHVRRSCPVCMGSGRASARGQVSAAPVVDVLLAEALTSLEADDLATLRAAAVTRPGAPGAPSVAQVNRATWACLAVLSRRRLPSDLLPAFLALASSAPP